MKKILIFLSVAYVFFIITMLIIKSVIFDVNCGGRLERAANANTISMAINELDAAIAYIEENNLTEGYTSIFHKSPSEDLSFWYQNIKSCRDELVDIPDDASILVTSNALLKLRESLLSNGEHGESLIIPNGISKYPDNLLWFCLSLFAFILVTFGSAILVYIYD